MLKALFTKLLRNRKGAAFVEYALLVGGIALIGAAAVSTFGHKTSDMLGAVAAIMPGAHVDDNAPIVSGKIIETAVGTGNGSGVGGAATDAIAVDVAGIAANSGTDRLGVNIEGAATNATTDLGTTLVLETK
jgi:Flp pilus assembly pilin Flp